MGNGPNRNLESCANVSKAFRNKEERKKSERRATQPHGLLGGFRALHQEGMLKQTSGGAGTRQGR